MRISEKQMLGIQDGIEEAFVEQGYELSSEEQLIIAMTVKATVGTVNEMLKLVSK